MITSTGSRTVRVWLTDGSPIPFTDVHRLNASHRGLFGLSQPYKGLIDAAVPCGTASVAAERPDDALSGEAEWVVMFPDGASRFIQAPERVDLATPVVFQGLIEGKWLNRLLGTTKWAPASLDNNLLAEGCGIATTLGAVEAGSGGEVRVEYPYARDGERRSQVQSATLADLRGQNILGLVRAVLGFCRDSGTHVDAINFSAVGPRAAIIGEPARINAAMRFPGMPIVNPLNLLPHRRFRMLERVVRGIIADGVTALAGEPMTLITRDERGRITGEGALVWRRPG